MNSTFATRTRDYLEKAAAAAQGWYDAEGRWKAASLPSEVRERFWVCFALYAQGRHDLANAVIVAADLEKSHMGWQNAAPYDIFHTNIGCVLLRIHREKMSAAVQKKLEKLVRDGFGLLPGNRQPDYQFHGGNDNMPSKATMSLILGGEMLDFPEAVEHGLWNLRHLRNMLIRRGTISEWNSPTYSPGSISAMAKIVNYAKNSEARELAAAVEERIWLDLAARFHPEIGVLSGPYARAYTTDSIAHGSCVSSLLWFLLGDVAKPSPMEFFNPDSGLVLHHKGDVPFNIAERCWFAHSSYHPSDRAVDLLLHKKYPFHAVANAEVGPAGTGFDARAVRLETFLQPDFTVGTASTPWANGDGSSPYAVTYKRTAEVKSFKDVGTVYHKFTLNDDEPGTIRVGTDQNNRTYSNSGEDDILHSRSHVVTFQSGPSALVLTGPDIVLAGEDSRPPQTLTRLSEMVVFPSHFGGADEIRVGSQAREFWSGEVTRGEWIGCRRGRLLIALRPLVYLPPPQTVKITLEKINRYEVLRTTFYHGEPRNFTRTELRAVFGGFVAEHASVDEYPSLEAFMKALSPTLFADYYWLTRRVRYRRPASAKRPALEFDIAWSPAAVTTRYALINGQPVSQETRVAIDGLKDSDFPLLNESWKSVASNFPWPRLYADWGTGNTTGFIGDREEG